MRSTTSFRLTGRKSLEPSWVLTRLLNSVCFLRLTDVTVGSAPTSALAAIAFMDLPRRQRLLDEERGKQRRRSATLLP
jgi:hypothetical protein